MTLIVSDNIDEVTLYHAQQYVNEQQAEGSIQLVTTVNSEVIERKKFLLVMIALKLVLISR